MNTLKQRLYWDPGWGVQIYIGLDPILGLGEIFSLSRNLVSGLHDKNIFVLSKFKKVTVDGGMFAGWFSASELGLSTSLGAEWDCYALSLLSAGIVLSDRPDQLVWDCLSTTGDITARLAY